MENRLMLAVVISMLIFVFFYAIRPKNNNNEEYPQENVTTPKKIISNVSEELAITPLIKEEDSKEETYTQDGFLKIVFDKMGNIKKYDLLKYKDQKEEGVEMFIPSKDDTQGLFFNFNSSKIFFVRKPQDKAGVLDFESEIEYNGTKILLSKVYTFENNSFLFSVKISMKSEDISKTLPSQNGFLYSISLTPQIGPRFKKLDNKNDFREYKYFDGEKLRGLPRLKNTNSSIDVDKDYYWISLMGKYFNFIMIPSAIKGKSIISNYDFIGSDNQSKPGDQLIFKSNNTNDSAREDLYYFYIGPNLKSELAKYNDPKSNLFKMSSTHLDKLVDASIFGFLENILKEILKLYYSLVPNWGVAIILLTFTVKLLLLPLHIKSLHSMQAMTKLGPKVEAIKNKHKDDPNKMNMEISNLYRKEKVSPMGGCLPLLLQMPFLFAMYGLFRKHFELRGASFISGWVDDLSAPDSIYSFGNYTLPILGWTEIRILPVLYLLSQFLSSYITQKQTPNQTATGNTAFMVYGFPIMFFFVLYDMPSGLLIYWIFQNIFSLIQSQIFNVKFLERMEARNTKNRGKNDGIRRKK